MLQNLQAVHAASPNINQAQHNKSHVVTMSTSDSSKPHFVQSAFPQGSILVVPHGSSPFGHTVLPMFGTSPMIVQQPVAGETAVAGSKDSPITLPTASIAAQAIPAIAPPTSVHSSSVVLLKDDTKNGKRSEADAKEPAAQAVILTTEQAKSLFTNQQSKSLFSNQSNMPIIVPPSLAGSMLSSMVPNYQQAFQYFAPICAMKVTEPVKMEDVSFDCKAIEISGEVPIKKVLVDGNKEESSEYIEVTDSVSEKQPPKAPDAKPETAVAPQPAMFEGHSSAEVMSARLLLSLTGRSENMIPQDGRALIEKAALSKPLTREEALAISTPVSSSSTSSGRKRKQTPIASARPSISDDISVPSKAKRVRKPKADGEKLAPKQRKTPQKKNAKSVASTPNQLSIVEPVAPIVGEEESLLTSQALATMQQLKASRVSKPMKEYVIETDSDSDSSSSGSSSSHANSDSSSESSSDSSSEEEVAQPKRGVTSIVRGRGRGRGRGRATMDRSKVSKAMYSILMAAGSQYTPPPLTRHGRKSIPA